MVLWALTTYLTFSFVALRQKNKYKAQYTKYVTYMSKFQTSFIIKILYKMDLIRITTLSWDIKTLLPDDIATGNFRPQFTNIFRLIIYTLL